MRSKLPLVFILFTNAYVHGQARFCETIAWGESLSWSDFKGRKGPGQPGAALSSCIIHLQISYPSTNTISVTVEAKFCKDRSWATDTNASLLAHEKGHFDIAELFARKLRQRIATNHFDDNKEEEIIMDLYRSTNKEMDVWHDQYDRETSHSRNKEAQTRWEAKINKEISSLVVYKKTQLERAVR